MKKIILIIFFSYYAVLGFSCECGKYTLKELDSISYNYHQIVIIGDVINTSSNFKIKVIEVLKGTVNDEKNYGTNKMQVKSDGEIVLGISSCAGEFLQKGKYLIYLDEITINNEKLYRLNDCSATRSLDMEDLPFCSDLHYEWQRDKDNLLKYTNDWIEKLRNLKNSN